MNPIDIHIPGVFQPAAWYILRLLNQTAWRAQPDVVLRIAGEMDPAAIHVNQRGPISAAWQAVCEKAEQINAELSETGPDAWLNINGVGDKQAAEAFDPSIRNRKMEEAQRALINRSERAK